MLKKVIYALDTKPFNYDTKELFQKDKLLIFKQLVDVNICKVAHSLWYNCAPKALLKNVNKDDNATREKYNFKINIYPTEKLRTVQVGTKFLSRSGY